MNKLEIAKAVIDDFSKGDYTSINDFCQRKNISLNTFYSYVEIIKQKSEELSDSYNKKMMKSVENTFIILWHQQS